MWPKFDARIPWRWMHGISRGGLVTNFGVAEKSKLGFRSLDSMEAEAAKQRIDGRMLPKIW